MVDVHQATYAKNFSCKRKFIWTFDYFDNASNSPVLPPPSLTFRRASKSVGFLRFCSSLNRICYSAFKTSTPNAQHIEMRHVFSLVLGTMVCLSPAGGFGGGYSSQNNVQRAVHMEYHRNNADLDEDHVFHCSDSIRRECQEIFRPLCSLSPS